MLFQKRATSKSRKATVPEFLPARDKGTPGQSKHRRDQKSLAMVASERTVQRAAPDQALGTVNRNVAPGPSFDSAHRRPPWLLTIERLIDSPMPIPFGLVV